ncbi:hypothetical protein ACOME3_010345 [Neoechinorhynchus agilis]
MSYRKRLRSKSDKTVTDDSKTDASSLQISEKKSKSTQTEAMLEDWEDVKVMKGIIRFHSKKGLIVLDIDDDSVIHQAVFIIRKPEQTLTGHDEPCTTSSGCFPNGCKRQRLLE